MPRLKNKVTGVVVNVDDELAEKLDGNWVSADHVPARRGRKPKVEDDSGNDQSE